MLGAIIGGIADAVLSDGGHHGGHNRPYRKTHKYGFMSGGHGGPSMSQQIQSVFGPMAFLSAAPVPQNVYQNGYRSSGNSAGPVRPFAPYRIATPYSSGRVKGLFIGINYVGVSGAELSGCVNDVSMMLKMLETISFPMQECCVLVDDPSFPNNGGMPTRDNIIQHMQWLVHDAKPGDCLFFHYSGHGSQTKDTSGDEDDGMDETLVPLDYRSAGCIIDDDIYMMLCSRLPAGVRLTAVMDCCHSGTLMDLPFCFEATSANMNAYGHGGAVMQQCKKMNTPCLAEVIMFSGCSDSQTSADVSNTASFGNQTSSYKVGNAGGACTNALTQVLTKTQGLSYMGLFKEMRSVLAQRKYAQVPQLTSSQPLDLNRPFSLFLANTSQQPVPFNAYQQPQQQPYSPYPGGYQQGGGYPPQQGGYPPQQQMYYPPQQPQGFGGYPPQGGGYQQPQYAPQPYQGGGGGYPSYPPAQQGYPGAYRTL